MTENPKSSTPFGLSNVGDEDGGVVGITPSPQGVIPHLSLPDLSGTGIFISNSASGKWKRIFPSNVYFKVGMAKFIPKKIDLMKSIFVQNVVGFENSFWT